MATLRSALQSLRKLCLSLPDAEEGLHFGEVCFRVRKRMFATCGEKDGLCQIVFQLESEHARRLVASDPRFRPYGRQKDGVWIDAADIRKLAELGPLILESYRLNAPTSGAKSPPRPPRNIAKRRPRRKSAR